MKCDRSQLLLYGVTDRSWLGERTLAQVVEQALEGGVTFLQLREKDLDAEAFRAEAEVLLPLCRAHGVPLIINDSVEVALACGADGVHLGQEDLDLARARALLGEERIIGVSAHSVEEALAAQAGGADYLGVGAIFGSTTKGDAVNTGLDTLADICRAVEIPVVAIGGVNAVNIPRLAGSGAAGAAIISGLFAQPDVAQAARHLHALLARTLG